jgi:hypothetical protein
MSRILPLLFLILPFVLFWAYVQFAAGYRERYGRGFYATHWYWVALAGVLGFIGCFIVQWAWFDHQITGRYVPPAYANGKIVPGHFEPDQNAGGPP